MQNAECRMQNDGEFLTHRSKIFINVPTNLLKVRILPFYRKAKEDIHKDVFFCWRAWQDSNLRPTGS